MAFIVVSVASMIGGAMISKTQNVTLGITSDATLINTLYSSTGSALTTLTSLLTLVALAIGGSIALRSLSGLYNGGGGNV